MGKASGSHLVQERDRLQGRAPCTIIQGPLRSDTRLGLMLSCHSLEILDHFIFELVKSEGTLESKRVQRVLCRALAYTWADSSLHACQWAAPAAGPAIW